MKKDIDERFGESVGRDEGTGLFIDTIGFNTRTFVDSFRTPDTEKLHVTERWHVIDGPCWKSASRWVIPIRSTGSAGRFGRADSGRWLRLCAPRVTKTSSISTCRSLTSQTFDR
jgi:hypothetical protein